LSKGERWVFQRFASDLYQKFAKEILTSPFVMPAKAGIQKHPIFLDSGSPPAFAGVDRNDGRNMLRISETPH
jgi:hypothetical protein